ncbi:glyoxalase superfamily protein [Paradevosia shaoguanensis]|uniref:glyoxalase superfamily protein n=1 Tax=Paradevosia shaoguanensis TaxID=1335043 RepID=UPI0019343F68|nr:glyoxalase superfamily protein [Paradevosia shaoguanensis]
MRTYLQAKAMARSLRTGLEKRLSVAISHSEALELVAGQFEFDDWNALSARIEAAPPPQSGSSQPAFEPAIPIIRIFSVEKAYEFYRDYLGMNVDWEHRYEPGLPLYAQVSRAGLVLHLSEHHGDATPGSTVFIWMKNLLAFHAELRSKTYPLRPGIDQGPGETDKGFEIPDPFGNRLRFHERGSTS